MLLNNVFEDDVHIKQKMNTINSELYVSEKCNNVTTGEEHMQSKESKA